MGLVDEILYGSLAGVKRAIAQQEDLNAIDDYGFTPLIETAIVNNIDIASYLLESGALVNGADLTGRTALHWACDNNQFKLAQLLLEKGADPNAYTLAGQPILVDPLLRDQQPLKKLLYQYGASLNFAQDFINTKLLGHRFELQGQVDIINSRNEFIEIDFEGFYLEFTLNIIRNSLLRYHNNYAARRLKNFFASIQLMINAFSHASELLHYQSYLVNIKNYQDKIRDLLNKDLLLMPIAYEGHAITLIKSHGLLAKCDRGENSKLEGTVVIYQIGNENKLSLDLLQYLIFQPQDTEFINRKLNQLLDLRVITHLPLPAQTSGNCSWANVEAAIPTMLFMLLLNENDLLNKNIIIKAKSSALSVYMQWLEWDKDRALDECIQSFQYASKPRRASKVAILAAILFQRCCYAVLHDLQRADKILAILTLPEFEYVLKSYIKIYYENNKTPAGNNLVQFLDL